VLEKLHPSLQGDDWLSKKFEEARKASLPGPPPAELYLALLAYRLSNEEAEEFLQKFRLRKLHAKALRDSHSLKAEIEALAEADIAPSHIYRLLHGYSQQALTAAYLANDSPTAKQKIQLFLTSLRQVKPSLTGKDLQKMGIPPGPRMKEVLQQLLEARLDGKIKDKKGEVEFVEGLV
jgi:tRNA nucleotidyltransferase (CCA-adding enzyme)